MNGARSRSSAALGLAPMICFTTSPPWKTLIVGIETMPYEAATRGFSSTLSFTTVMSSLCSLAISSRIGETARQGPHHSAQKSTMTVLSLLRTSTSNEASVTAGVLAPTIAVLPLVLSVQGLEMLRRAPSTGDAGHAADDCLCRLA